MGSQVVAVDVGGTFIDLVSIDPGTGLISVEKQPATPGRLAEELVTGLGRLPVEPSEVGAFLHGTTVTINALVQRRCARVGLITTAGFRDVLALGRGNRPSIYDWVWVPPEPMVPRELRREVRERLGPGGDEVERLDREALDREVDALVAGGVDAVAICFLHAYANPKHEREAADAIALRHPSLAVTLSSEVAAEWHEYERTSTAVINASLTPVLAGYLHQVRERLTEAGMTAPIALMQSNGGTMTLERAAELPVRTLASGPAGGVMAAAALARTLGHTDVICTDVGGTTYDVATIEGGRVQERTETQVEGLPVLAPTVDVVSIGAGGGSIAWFDDTDALRVGPLSAGARPGPACFGLGGDRPTVTDCQLVLGRLDPARFLGARMRLDPAAAERAIHDVVASRLGMSTRDAALGILTIAESAMANAIGSMTVERGLDPRELVLYAYGGGGGLFGAAVAGELDIPTIVVPRAAATFSAWGIASSGYREDASVTKVRPLDDDAMDAAVAELRSLGAELTERLGGLAPPGTEVAIERRADLRFGGQEHTVTVDLDAGWTRADTGALADRFVARHRRLYGHGDRDAAIEIVTVRCRATIPGTEPAWPAWTVREPCAPEGTRPVVFGAGDPAEVPVFERDRLGAGQHVEGPAVIEEWTSTTLVPPGWTSTTDELGNLILTATGASR